MTKIVSLSESAYEELSRLKREGESFSSVVRRIAEKEKRRSIMEFYGAWADKKGMDKIFLEISKEREKSKFREVRI
ncbi:MAG: hypothetical protein HYW25_05840 [Candidatus Aenigmarchaeota archaeon]|nr:hypothetical protein [Candidatus Aenigmarchaeota archaeon]